MRSILDAGAVVFFAVMLALSWTAAARAEPDAAGQSRSHQKLMEDLDGLSRALDPSGDALDLLREPQKRPAADLVVQLSAEAGAWTARYMDRRRIVEPGAAVVLPAGLAVELRVLSADLIYEMAIPGLGIKFEAIPGRVGVVSLVAARPGDFEGTCAPSCGRRGAPILVRVVPRDQFDSWLASPTP